MIREANDSERRRRLGTPAKTRNANETSASARLILTPHSAAFTAVHGVELFPREQLHREGHLIAAFRAHKALGAWPPADAPCGRRPRSPHKSGCAI